MLFLEGNSSGRTHGGDGGLWIVMAIVAVFEGHEDFGQPSVFEGPDDFGGEHILGANIFWGQQILGA